MKAALYNLHYIHSTHNYGISFTPNNMAPMHSYIHYHPSSDVEAYTNTTPPKLGSLSTLSAYHDACWGSPIGSAVADGTLLPLFKFHSMNSGIVFKNGGLIGWLGKHQECTSLSLGYQCYVKTGCQFPQPVPECFRLGSYSAGYQFPYGPLQ